MRKGSLYSRGVLIFLPIFILSANLRQSALSFAADQKVIFNSVKLEPSELKAGGALHIRVILQNGSKEVWESGQYNVSLELLSEDKGSIKKTAPYKMRNRIEAGKTCALEWKSVNVPPNLSGKYYCRILVLQDTELVRASAMMPFSVLAPETEATPAASLPPAIPQAPKIARAVPVPETSPRDNSIRSSQNEFDRNSHTEKARGNFAIGLNYSGAHFRAFMANHFAVEGRGDYSESDKIKTWAGGMRTLWYFNPEAKRLQIFTGLEGDYLSFQGLTSKGTGFAGVYLLGGELFLSKSFSFQFDFGPTYISIKHQDSSDKETGIDFMYNFGLTYYFAKG